MFRFCGQGGLSLDETPKRNREAAKGEASGWYATRPSGRAALDLRRRRRGRTTARARPRCRSWRRRAWSARTGSHGRSARARARSPSPRRKGGADEPVAATRLAGRGFSPVARDASIRRRTPPPFVHPRASPRGRPAVRSFAPRRGDGGFYAKCERCGG